MNISKFMDSKLKLIKNFIYKHFPYYEIEFVRNASSFNTEANYKIYLPYNLNLDKSYSIESGVLRESFKIGLPKVFYIDLELKDILMPLLNEKNYSIFYSKEFQNLQNNIIIDINNYFGEFLTLELNNESDIEDALRKLSFMGYSEPFEAYILLHSKKPITSNPFKISRFYREIESLYEILKNKHDYNELKKLGYRNLAEILKRYNYKGDTSILSFLEKS